MRLWHLAALTATVSPCLALAQESSNGAPGNAGLQATELPQHIVKILRTTNKAQTNRYVARVYDLKSVNPYAVIRWVRRTMEIEEGFWHSFAKEDMKSGKLLVVCPEYQLAGLDELIATIDREGLTSSGGDKRILWQPKHRSVLDAGIVSNAVLGVTETGVLIPDPEISGIFVEDSPTGIANIVAAMAEYDIPTPNWEATATVYEIDLSDDGQIGLDYQSWKNGPGRNLFAIGAFSQREKITEFNDRASTGSLIYNSGKGVEALPDREYESSGRNAAYMYDVPSAYFDYLVDNGFGRTLTKSKIVTLCNSTALLEIGEDVLFYKVNHAPDQRAGSRLEPLDPYGTLEPFTDTSATGEKTDTYGVRVADHPDNRTVVPTTTARSLGSVKSGFTMQVTPLMFRDMVSVNFKMSFVDVTGFADDGSPVLSNRSAESTFRLPYSGGEMVIGGVVRTRRVDGANQMPWLGDIPVLGYLFGGKSKLEQKSMVVVSMQMRALQATDDNTTDEERAATGKGDGSVQTPTLENNPNVRPN